MSKLDTAIFYDGAWHDPCSGSKTLWHFENGAWHKFPCEAEKIIFTAYPSENAYWARVYAINADGSIINRDGVNKITAYTMSTYAVMNQSEIRYTVWSRDYTKLYGYKLVGERATSINTFSDMFLYFSGSDVSSDVTWDFTGNAFDITLPFWIETEISSDGGFKWLFYDNSGTPTDFVPIMQALVDGSATQTIGLFKDTTGDGLGPDGWELRINGGTVSKIYGHVEEDRWHNIATAPPYGGLARFVVDDEQTDTFHGGLGRVLDSVSLGILSPNSGGGGWIYTNRVKIGSFFTLQNLVAYQPSNDGYPWQYQGRSFSSTPPQHYPNMETSPDLFTRKLYTVTIHPSDYTMGDYVNFSYPSFATAAAEIPPSGGEWASEIWDIDTTGSVDTTKSDAPGFPNARILHVPMGVPQDHPTYPVGFPNTYRNMRIQVTGQGLDALIEHYGDQDPYPNNLNVISLYRVDTDTGTKHLIKDGNDYPIVNGSRRYQQFDAGFSPSGNLIWSMRNNETTGRPCLEVWNRDGSNYRVFDFFDTTFGVPNIYYAMFDPLNEDQFYYTGARPSYQGGQPYFAVYRGILSDGTIHAFVIPNQGPYAVFDIPKISPDGSRLGFSGQIDDVTPSGYAYILSYARDSNGDNAGDGRDHTNDFHYNQHYPLNATNNWSWSRDGSQIVFADDTSGDRPSIWTVSVADNTQVQQIISSSDGITALFMNNLSWFYGHQSE